MPNIYCLNWIIISAFTISESAMSVIIEKPTGLTVEAILKNQWVVSLSLSFSNQWITIQEGGKQKYDYNIKIVNNSEKTVKSIVINTMAASFSTVFIRYWAINLPSKYG